MPPEESAREETACLICGEEQALDGFSSLVQFAPATGESFRFVRCPRCELLYLSPRPSVEGMARYYPPDYLPFRGARAWGRWAPLVRRSEGRVDRARVRVVTGSRKLTDSTSVLDVGCGRPTFLRALHSTIGARCFGIDPSDTGWAGETDRWTGLELVRGSVSTLQDQLARSAPGGFEVITLWHALEHEHTPLTLLTALRELAAPGALLVVEVPDAGSIPARIQGSSWGGLHTPRHTAAYTPNTLARLLEEAGWMLESHRRRGTLDPYVLWWLGRQASRGRSLTGSLEHAFSGFVAGRIAAAPIHALQRWIPLGIQLATATTGPRH